MSRGLPIPEEHEQAQTCSYLPLPMVGALLPPSLIYTAPKVLTSSQAPPLSLPLRPETLLARVLCIPGLPVICKICCGREGAWGQGTPTENLTLWVSVRRKRRQPSRAGEQSTKAES